MIIIIIIILLLLLLIGSVKLNITFGMKKCEFTDRNKALRNVTNVYDLQPLTACSHKEGYCRLLSLRSLRRAEKTPKSCLPKN